MENQEDHLKTLITITHFVSPSQFYFRDLDDGTMQKKIDKIEHKLKEQVEDSESNYYRNMQQFYEPKRDDIVAYFDQSNQKWIRCVVDSFDIYFNTQQTVLLWSIDYGFPFQTILPDGNLRKVPDEFGIEHKFIKLGSLNLVSAEKRFNLFQSENEPTKATFCKEWKKFAMSCFMFQMKSTNVIFFKPRFKDMEITKTWYGELFFGGARDSFGDFLVSNGAAIKPKTMREFITRRSAMIFPQLRTGESFNKTEYGLPDWRSRKIEQKIDVKIPESIAPVEPDQHGIMMITETSEASYKVKAKAKVDDWLANKIEINAAAVDDDTSVVDNYFSCDSDDESDIMSSVSRAKQPECRYVFD